MGIPSRGSKRSLSDCEKMPENPLGKDTRTVIPRLGARDVVKRFSERTSMHGCIYVQTSRHNVSKIIWTIVLFTVFVGLVVHLYRTTKSYLEFPKATKVSLSFNNLRFPAVTVCNVNPIRKSKLDEIVETELHQLLDKIDPETVEDTITDALSNLGLFGKKKNSKSNSLNLADIFNEIDFDSFYDGVIPTLLRSSNADDDDWNTDADSEALLLDTFRFLYMQINRENRSKAGHQIEDMLMSCSFGGRKCFASNFTLYQTPSYGNCFTLDSIKMVTKQPGPSGGLSINLYLQTNDFINGLTNGYGIKLIVHDRGTKVLPEDEGVLIASGTETNIGLRQTHIERLSKPYGNCASGLNFRRRFGSDYTLKMCQVSCLATRIKRRCDCWHHMHEVVGLYVDNDDFRICNTTAESSCALNMLEKSKRKELDCACENPCNQVQYDMSISSRQWPTYSYARVLESMVCKKYPDDCKDVSINQLWSLSNDFVKLNIFYETLNFESIVEEPLIDEFSFLSSVGGALGLWIGLSLLSVCEILQLLIELVTCLVNRVTRVESQ